MEKLADSWLALRKEETSLLVISLPETDAIILSLGFWLNKKRLKDKVCHLDQTMLDRVNHALEISLELTF